MAMDLRGSMLAAAAVVLLAVACVAPVPASGQAVATSCTAAMITGFTPCFSYITGSMGGSSSSSPTVACCKSLEAVVSTSASCACLVLTGNVPLGVPFNRTLAVTLPKACNSMAVPLQCKDSSTQLPAPGPAAVSPAMAPPLTPTTTELAPAPPTVVAAAPATSQAQTKPQVVPSSAWRHGDGGGALLLLLVAAGAVLV